MISKIDSNKQSTTFGYNEAASYRWFAKIEAKYPGWRNHPKRAMRHARKNGETLIIRQSKGLSVVRYSDTIKAAETKIGFFNKLLSKFKKTKNS